MDPNTLTIEKKEVPNPGSKDALSQGCKCPVLDNCRGRGAFVSTDGKPQFWVNDDCPLHGDNSND